jgi:hypothetical protein
MILRSIRGGCVLTLWAGQPECLWGEALLIEVRELPEDLTALDLLLSDLELARVFLERSRQEVVDTGRLVSTEGRPRTRCGRMSG